MYNVVDIPKAKSSKRGKKGKGAKKSMKRPTKGSKAKSGWELNRNREKSVGESLKSTAYSKVIILCSSPYYSAEQIAERLIQYVSHVELPTVCYPRDSKKKPKVRSQQTLSMLVNFNLDIQEHRQII